VLHAEAVNLVTLAASIGTPFYCYSTATLERHYRVFAGAFADVSALVCYAMKANSNQAVIRTLARLGAGLMSFPRVSSSEGELALAVDEDILCVNVESEAELERLRSAETDGRAKNGTAIDASGLSPAPSLPAPAGTACAAASRR
jgi:diaminopimelate decarboxylase